MQSDKIQENRVRRLARRNGYEVRKSRRPVSLDNLGEYMLVETHRNFSALGSRYDAPLDHIEAWLRD